MKTKESMLDYLKRAHSKVLIFYYFGRNTFQKLFFFCTIEHVSIPILPKHGYNSTSCLWLSCLIFDNFFCVYIVVMVRLYCYLGGWMPIGVYPNFVFKIF